MQQVFKISGLNLFYSFTHFSWAVSFLCCNTDAISSLCHLLFTIQLFSIDSCDVFSHQWLQIQSHQTEMTSPTGNTNCSTILSFFFQQWHLQTLKCNYCTTQRLHTGFIIYVSSYFNWIKESETGVRSSGRPSFHRLYMCNESKKIFFLLLLLPAFSHALCKGIICCIKRTKSRDKWWILIRFPIILMSQLISRTTDHMTLLKLTFY